MDPSEPLDFDGIDYSVRPQIGARIYNTDELTNRTVNVLEAYFQEKGLKARKCHPTGLGAAAGGPFAEVLSWIIEHWEFVRDIAQWVFSGLTTLVLALRTAYTRWIERTVIDPYQPTLTVELGVRQSPNSFRALLRLAPDIQSMLKNKLPDQTFAIRFLDASPGRDKTYVFFKLQQIRKSDVARMIHFLDKHEFHEGLSAALLYRRFGFWPSIIASKKPGDFMRLLMR